MDIARSSTTLGAGDRWYAEVTYAMDAGELLPVDVHVRLLPPDVSLSQVQGHKDYAHLQERVHAGEDLGPIPAGGLSQRQLCAVPIAGLADQFRAAARMTASLGVELATDLTAYTGEGKRGPGRPPATPMRDRLRLLYEVETGYAAGESLDDIAGRLHLSRSSLRDLLSWARNDAEPRLFTNPGRGKRGGQLTPEARLLRDRLEAKDATDGKR